MKQLFLLFCGLIFVLAGCDGSEDPDPIPGPPDGEKAQRTVLAYILAENSLGDGGFAAADIKEMMQGMQNIDSEKNNLLVFLDDSKDPVLFRIAKNRKGEVVCDTIQRYEEQLTNQPDIMYSIMEKALTKYPAESYGLILWSHGDGWLPYTRSVRSVNTRSFGQDGGTSGPFMNISELETVLKRCRNLIGGKFDYIYFDACFMQNIETVYQLRDYASYYVGCVTETPGPGSPYVRVMPSLFELDVKKAVTDLVGDYHSYYASGDGREVGWLAAYGASLSVVQTDGMEQLAKVSAEMISKYADKIPQLSVYELQFYDWRYPPAYFDMAHFMQQILSPSDYTIWESALQGVVTRKETTPKCYSMYLGSVFPMDHYCGLACYIPKDNADHYTYNQYFKTYDWCTDGGWAAIGW